MVTKQATCAALLMMAAVVTSSEAVNKERQDFSSDHDDDTFGFTFPFESAREFVDDLSARIDPVNDFPGEGFKNYGVESVPDEHDRISSLPVEAHYPHPPNFGSRSTRSKIRSDSNSHTSGYHDAAEPFFREEVAASPRDLKRKVLPTKYPNAPPEQSDISYLPPVHSVRFSAPKPDMITYSPSTRQVTVSYEPRIRQEINYSDNGDIEIIQKIPLHRKISRTAVPSVKPIRSTLVKHASAKPTSSSFHKPFDNFFVREPSVKPIESTLHRDATVKPIKSSPVFKRDSIKPFDTSYHGQPSIKPITSSIQKPRSHGLHSRTVDEPYQPPVYIPRPNKAADPYKSPEEDTSYKQPPVDYVVAKPTQRYKPSHKPPHHETYEPIHDPHKPVHEPYKPPHKPVHDPYKPPHKPVHDPYKPPHKPVHDPYKPPHKPVHDSYKPPHKHVHDSYKPQQKPIYEKPKVIKPLEPVFKPAYNKPKQIHNIYKPLHDPYKPLDEHFLHDEAPYKKPSIPGKPGSDYPVYSQVPYTDFSCSKVPYRPGMYANVEAQCQVYHVCNDDRYGDQGAAFLCTNGTVFNQATFNCDWWYNVDCGQATHYYDLNLDPDHNPYYQKPYEGPLHIPTYDDHPDPHYKPSYRSEGHTSAPSTLKQSKPFKSFDASPEYKRSAPPFHDSPKPSYRHLPRDVPPPSYQGPAPLSPPSFGASSFQSSGFKFT